MEDETLEDDEEITDIHVISLQLSGGSRDDESEEDFALEDEAEQLPAAVICFGTDKGSVHIALNLDGVEPQWLPSAARVSIL